MSLYKSFKWYDPSGDWFLAVEEDEFGLTILTYTTDAPNTPDNEIALTLEAAREIAEALLDLVGSIEGAT